MINLCLPHRFYEIHIICYLKKIIFQCIFFQLSDDHALPLRKDFFETIQSVESSGHFINMRQRIARLSLPPGDYIVVPCTWDPNEEAAFYLRFFFENRNTVEWVKPWSKKKIPYWYSSVVWLSRIRVISNKLLLWKLIAGPGHIP